MFVMYFDLAKVNLFIFMLPIKTGIEVVDNKMFAFTSLRLIKSHDQSWQQNYVCEHGYDKGH